MASSFRCGASTSDPYAFPVDPKPPAPRALASNSSTTWNSTCTTGITTSCAIRGGKVGEGLELEGDVLSGNATSFRLDVEGHRSASLVQVDAGGADFQCHPKSGPQAPTQAQCRASVVAGAKVHVKGRLQSCDAVSARVDASRVTVQK